MECVLLRGFGSYSDQEQRAIRYRPVRCDISNNICGVD